MRKTDIGKAAIHQLEMSRRTASNVVILGPSGVGKSAIKVWLLNRTLRDQTIDTKLTVDGNQHSICITTEQEEFVAMREQYMKQGDGFIFLYSITDFNSFVSLSGQLQTFYRSCGQYTKPIMLVGNKLDLRDQRKVSRRAGASLAQVLDCNFMEVSAESGENVREMMAVMVKQIANAIKK